ncbi:MAG: hypothetical protein ACP5VS_04600 [Desulfomonilaceae bacterium]
MATDASALGVLLFDASDEEHKSIYTELGAGLENGALTHVIGRWF